MIKINSIGKSITEKFAPKYYGDYSLGIDFTDKKVKQKLKEKEPATSTRLKA